MLKCKALSGNYLQTDEFYTRLQIVTTSFQALGEIAGLDTYPLLRKDQTLLSDKAYDDYYWQLAAQENKEFAGLL